MADLPRGCPEGEQNLQLSPEKMDLTVGTKSKHAWDELVVTKDEKLKGLQLPKACKARIHARRLARANR